LGRIREFWRRSFDVRADEIGRMVFMAGYLLLVLLAYYILKPVSRAMFINRFEIDDLPYLYIVIAFAGGLMAYFYTKLAIHTSLKTAVNVCTFGMIGALVLIWHLLSYNWPWLLYVFNAFVSLFSITLVSQGWLVASNVFSTREAKRLYGLLGLSAVIGAAIGGEFTNIMVRYIGSRNLLLASAGFVFLAYLAFLGVSSRPQVSLKEAKGAEEEETYSLKELGGYITRYRHLQVIMAVIMLTYIVDVTVEYQFNAMSKLAYPNPRDLTAFLGRFYGRYLNLITFTFQFFLTTFVVRTFGVGGALQIMPVSIAAASVATYLVPGIFTTGATRLTEAATRYTFNRTGMELLYLPLPLELRNRTKAFTDIFMDRFARGIGGVILLLFTTFLDLSVAQLALAVIAYTFVWIFLALRAKNEYISTVRNRLASRRLDLDSLRVNVNDANTVRLLEETTEVNNGRQAVYALSLLAEAHGYKLERRLQRLIESKLPELRGKVYELAKEREFRGLYDKALEELRSSRFGDDADVVRPAVEYALWVSSDTPDLAKRLLNHPNQLVARSALAALAGHPEASEPLITPDWIADAGSAPDKNRRVMAAIAVGVRGDGETKVLHKLLQDPDAEVVAEAAKTAAKLQNRMYLDSLLRLLTSARTRGIGIEALTAYGDRIAGTLADVLLDTTTPVAVRRQIPRVLKNIPTQRSVDALFQAYDEPDLSVRTAALRSLGSLREKPSKLSFGRESLHQHISREAKYYYETAASLYAFRENKETPAARLLAATLEDRLKRTLERLFRLLGLKYPPKEMHAAYLALNRKSTDEYTAAIEFLDNVLEREFKRMLLPLLDEEARIVQTGRDLFGVEVKDPSAALRRLLRSGDSWIVACAAAAAAELGLHDLRGEIEPLARNAGADVGAVARSALASLSAA
jgi:ATP:ADP antiporter, AAA family